MKMMSTETSYVSRKQKLCMRLDGLYMYVFLGVRCYCKSKSARLVAWNHFIHIYLLFVCSALSNLFFIHIYI